MTRFTRREIEDIYRTHPLRQETILRRVLDRRGSYAGLTALDLAEDPVTEISDQNHIGGLAYTRRLAEQARISRATTVLDLGCGLGGSARCLASLYGCRVRGIDLSPERIADARQLTAMVGSDRLVTFDCADVMTAPLPVETFDVLWGQSAWGHLERKSEFLQKWITALKPGGRVAVEDVCLRRQPAGGEEQALLAALEDHWKSHLVALDGDGGWRAIVGGCGVTKMCVEDCSADLLDHFVALQKGAATPGASPVSEFEQRAWRLAIAAAKAGLIGYFRLVAETGASRTDRG